MRRHYVLFGMMLALLLATPLMTHAQNGSFESLWAVYDENISYSPAWAAALLDSIEGRAVSEKNAYQHFRVNWKRIYFDHSTDRKSLKTMLLSLDSLRQKDVASQWNAPDPELYRSLYHYLSGMVLMSGSRYAHIGANTQNSDIQRMEEWVTGDFHAAAKEHFRACFDHLPTDVEFRGKWEFLTTKDAKWTVFVPTLFDVLAQNCLDYFYQDKEMVEWLVDRAIESHSSHKEKAVDVHFELLRLSHLYELPRYPVDSSEYWKEIARLETVYGSDEAFDYTRGVLLYSVSRQMEKMTDYPARALHYFDHVMREGETPYYRVNAGYYIEQLTLPQIELSNAQYYLPPGRKLRVPVTYANIDTLYVSVYRRIEADAVTSPQNEHSVTTFSPNWCSDLGKLVYTQRFVLENHGKNLYYTTELWLDSLPRGHYTVFFHQGPELDSLNALMRTSFCVSRLKVSKWNMEHHEYVAVNDFNTGKPIPGCSVNVPWKMTRFSNRFGEIHYQRLFFSVYDITKIHDNNVEYKYYYFSGDYPWIESKVMGRRYHRLSRRIGDYHGRLFTDRGLYRPGQTAYFKFVLFNGKGKLVSNQEVVVLLRDDKYTVLDSMRLTTNEFGSVSGEFRMPGKIGKYHFRWECPGKRLYQSGNLVVEVAEYKLPSFKVELVDDSAQTATGDTLNIRGRVTALNGFPIRDADVVISVEYVDTKKFNLVTDEEGRFSCPYLVPRSGDKISLKVEAVVTDVNGETHQDRTVVIVPPRSLTIHMALGKDLDLSARDTLPMTVKAVNFEQIPQAVPLRVTVMRLQSPDHYRVPVLEKKPERWEPYYSREEYARQFPFLTWNLDENAYRCWPVVDTVFTTEWTFYPDSLLLIDIHNWETGDYKISTTGLDKRGKVVVEERHFTVNRSSSQEFNTFMPIRVAITDFPSKAGGKMSLSVGSCLHDAVMICDVYQGRKRLKTLCVPLDHEQKQVTVKTRRSNDRHISVLARIVQHGKLHCATIDSVMALDPVTQQKIVRSLMDNTLNAELTHYKKVAEPGENEEWEISIQDGHRRAAKEVEMLAWMIDCSLYELGMKEPGYDLLRSNSALLSKSLRRRLITTVVRRKCKDISLVYPNYVTFREKTRRFLPGPYEIIPPLPTYSARNYSWTGRGSDEAHVMYEPPVFSMDNTPSSGGDITEALNSLAGVASEDGAITSVRGNRSDGQVTIIDGMRVRGKVYEEETRTVTVSEEREKPAPSPDIRVRQNFTETAFFYPQLRTDKQGLVKFRFTLPDQYTNWQLFATGHDKRVVSCKLTAYLQSRRTVMLQSNAPRFLREGDTMDFAAKVVNAGEKCVRGEVTLEFLSVDDNQPIKMIFDGGKDKEHYVSATGVQPFVVEAGASQEVHFRVVGPEGVSAVNCRIVARCSDPAAVAGDGEERTLPVLPNRVLVTEAKHFTVPACTDLEFTFRRYRDARTSTMRPLSYTLEVTANPVWLAIYSLPSLMRYPYECNEQLFSKLFAAAVVRHALKQTPELEGVFERWRNDTLNGSLESPLLKNETLRNILLEETPWFDAAQNESRQRQENAELFTAENLDRQLNRNLNKLMRNQLPGGGWDWYGCYGYSRYITDYLIAGFYKLQRMGVELSADAERMLARAVRQSDRAQEERYQKYWEAYMKDPETRFYFSEEDVHYLYARSFAPFDSVWLSKPYVQNLLNLARTDIFKACYMRQAEMALVLHRFGMTKEANSLVDFLRYNAFRDEEFGMYWGEKPGNRRRDWRISGYYSWYEAPVERQAMLIEAYAEISPDEEELTAMKQWLLLQKEGNSWKSTKASSAAVYALLLNAPKDILVPARTTVVVGDESFTTALENNAEDCSGYLKHVWTAEEMTPQLASVYVHPDCSHPVIGACYWQYLEIPDQVTASGDGLTIRRTLLHQPSEGDGVHAVPVTAENPMRLGERVTVRLVITSDRELEYVHVKDPRTAAFEPVDIHERRGRNQGVWWVETPRDAAEHFFLNSLPQGSLVIEYDLLVTQTGAFSHAPATVECMYAPSHRAQTDGARVTVR